MDKDELLKKWKDLPIKRHYFVTKDYIVFLNENNEMDWKIDYENTENTNYNQSEFNRLINISEEITTQNVNITDEKINKRFFQILGSGLAKLCEFDYLNAEKSFEQAKIYITEMNYETTRMWKLQATVICSMVIALVGFLFLSNYSGNNFILKMFIFSLFGSIGVLLSTFINLKNIRFNIETGMKNIYFESFSRIIIGIVISFIGLLAIKCNLILSTLNDIKIENIEVLYSVLLAPSQTLIPSLFHRFEKMEEKNDK
jgi:hypothetical protein